MDENSKIDQATRGNGVPWFLLVMTLFAFSVVLGSGYYLWRQIAKLDAAVGKMDSSVGTAAGRVDAAVDSSGGKLEATVTGGVGGLLRQTDSNLKSETAAIKELQDHIASLKMHVDSLGDKIRKLDDGAKSRP